jgi:hypothetical protein
MTLADNQADNIALLASGAPIIEMSVLRSSCPLVDLSVVISHARASGGGRSPAKLVSGRKNPWYQAILQGN